MQFLVTEDWVTVSDDLKCRMKESKLVFSSPQVVSTHYCLDNSSDITIETKKRIYEIEMRVCKEGTLLDVTTIRKESVPDMDKLVLEFLSESKIQNTSTKTSLLKIAKLRSITRSNIY